MATYLAAGKLSPSTFRLALLTLETRKASRFGFTLRGETAPDGKSKFVLRFTETQKLCSGLEYDPATKKLALQEFCS